MSAPKADEPASLWPFALLRRRFAWGRSRLPLSAEQFSQSFKIQAFARAPADAYLPVAHTCFFSLELPRYSSREVCRRWTKEFYCVSRFTVGRSTIYPPTEFKRAAACVCISTLLCTTHGLAQQHYYSVHCQLEVDGLMALAVLGGLPSCLRKGCGCSCSSVVAVAAVAAAVIFVANSPPPSLLIRPLSCPSTPSPPFSRPVHTSGAGGEAPVRDLSLPGGRRRRHQRCIQRCGPGLGRRPVRSEGAPPIDGVGSGR